MMMSLLLCKKIMSSCVLDDTYGTVAYMMLLLGVGCIHVRKTQPAWPIIFMYTDVTRLILFGLIFSTVSALVKAAIASAFVLVTYYSTEYHINDVFSVKVIIFISDAKGRRWGFSSSSKGIILVSCSTAQWLADLCRH